MHQRSILERILAIFLSVCLIIVSGGPTIVEASSVNVEMTDGKIKFSIRAKEGDTGIRYRTVGWMVHTQSSDRAMSLGSSKVVDIIDFKQYDERTNGDGTVTTYFEVDENRLTNYLIGTDMATYTNGKTIYFSSIFSVVRNGSVGSKKYYTYSDIAAAEGWSPEALRDMKDLYNIRVSYDMPPQAVNKVIRVNGKGFSRESMGKENVGESTPVTFKKTITDKGKTYELDESWGEYIANGKIVQKASGSTLTRNITTPVGGIDIVGNYTESDTSNPDPNPDPDPDEKPDPPPSTGENVVDVIYKAGNTTLKQSRHGSFKVAEVVSVPLDSSFSKNGKTYVLKSSILERKSDGFEYASAGAALVRNFPVSKGGENVIAYYEEGSGPVDPPKPPKDDLEADLVLSASPGTVIEGADERVDFELDAGGSYADNGIFKYEWWFGTSRSDLNGSPMDWTKEDYIDTGDRVNSETTYYAKVRITDNKGNTDEAEDSITIRADEPILLDDPEVTLTLDNGSVFLPGEIGEFDTRILEGGDRYDVIDRYWDIEDERNSNVDYEDDAELGRLRLNYKPGFYTAIQTISWEDGYLNKHRADDSVRFEIRDIRPPEVRLKADKSSYHVRESVLYTPQFIEDGKFTYTIEKKEWKIKDSNGQVVASGEGNIPESYTYHLHSDTGTYSAEQTIYYYNQKAGNKLESATATCDYQITGLILPEVEIDNLKSPYYTPENGQFTTAYVHGGYDRFPIDHKKWRLKNSRGIVIDQGTGDFPKNYKFGVDFIEGEYIAEQEIVYIKRDVANSIFDRVDFEVITPIPVAEMEIEMKMSNAPIWETIEYGKNKGKQYKQIRIDLTDSILANQILHYPWPVLFSDLNTQIKVIPLNDSLGPNYSKNKTLGLLSNGDKVIENQEFTIKGKQMIDIRFDEVGRYRIKSRVANQYYVGDWISRDIEIRPDLPPIIEKIEIVDVPIDSQTGEHRMLRNKENLQVNYGVNVTIKMVDEDLPDPNSAILTVAYDYNGNNNNLDDGVHSKQEIKLSSENKQNYLSVTKNATMKTFRLNLNSVLPPILGKIGVEYSTGKIATIPYFTGGDLPEIPYVVANSSQLPTNSKIVHVGNDDGVVTIHIGKEESLEIVILKKGDADLLDIDKLASFYGDEAKIYIIDKNGKKQMH